MQKYLGRLGIVLKQIVDWSEIDWAMTGWLKVDHRQSSPMIFGQG